MKCSVKAAVFRPREKRPRIRPPAEHVDFFLVERSLLRNYKALPGRQTGRAARPYGRKCFSNLRAARLCPMRRGGRPRVVRPRMFRIAAFHFLLHFGIRAFPES